MQLELCKRELYIEIANIRKELALVVSGTQDIYAEKLDVLLKFIKY